MLANRLHYVFNLKGPSLLINSACTSAMYALHLAVTSIRNGDCDSAIVAGSNWIMDPSSHIAMGKLGALSATSRSHTFDASADGYARGEGFAALYIKKASSAIQDASPIRAFIRGTAVNANGRTTSITNPSGAAQEIVIREA
jgi:acyl transferase domain-containing protein